MNPPRRGCAGAARHRFQQNIPLGSSCVAGTEGYRVREDAASLGRPCREMKLVPDPRVSVNAPRQYG
jgi:hypothetical protein